MINAIEKQFKQKLIPTLKKSLQDLSYDKPTSGTLAGQFVGAIIEQLMTTFQFFEAEQFTSLNNKEKLKIAEILTDYLNSTFNQHMTLCCSSMTKFELTQEEQNKILEYISQKLQELQTPIENIQRIQHDDNLRVRRLDSLAVLLELDSTISICSAVTFVNDCIVIAANGADRSMDDDYEIPKKLHTKLSIIKNFLFIQSTKDDPSVFNHDEMDLCIARLHAFGKSSLFSIEELKLELIKLTNSVPALTGSPFTENETLVLTNKYFTETKIIYPELIANQIYLKAITFNQEGNLLADDNLTTIQIHRRVKASHIHAEQLLSYYINTITTPLQQYCIGVSKLCCTTCYNAFRDTQFLVRGTHGLTFPNTVNLRDLSHVAHITCQTPKRSADTACITKKMETPGELIPEREHKYKKTRLQPINLFASPVIPPKTAHQDAVYEELNLLN